MPKLTKKRSSAKNASEHAKKMSPNAKIAKIAKTRQTVKLIARNRDNRTEVLEIVDNICNGRETSKMCSHYLIGATSYRKLMTGTFNLEKAHQHLLPKQFAKDFFWQIGEKKSEISHPGEIKQAIRVHPFIPFLCAKPDIYCPSHGFIVETKSTESLTELKKYENVIPRPVLIQMLLEMECFNVKEGRLYVHMFENSVGHQPRRFYQKYKYILSKTVDFIQEEDIPLIVDRYLQYLKHFILELGKQLPPSLEQEVKELFIREILIRKSIYDHHGGSPSGEIKIRDEEVGIVCKKYGAQPRTTRKVAVEGKVIERPGKSESGYDKPFYDYEEFKEIDMHIIPKMLNFDEKQRKRINRAMRRSLDKRLEEYKKEGFVEGRDVNYSVMSISADGLEEEK